MTARTSDGFFKTGNELMDRQHQDLAALIDALRDVQSGSESEALSTVDKIMAVAFEHCYSEEDLMRQYGYPHGPTQRMVEQHRAFMSHARFLALAFCKDQTLGVGSLRSFLEEFLGTHQLAEDRLLAEWIREQKESAANS
jgi:hemerythrin-like metal-binding protein